MKIEIEKLENIDRMQWKGHIVMFKKKGDKFVEDRVLSVTKNTSSEVYDWLEKRGSEVIRDCLKPLKYKKTSDIKKGKVTHI